MKSKRLGASFCSIVPANSLALRNLDQRSPGRSRSNLLAESNVRRTMNLDQFLEALPMCVGSSQLPVVVGGPAFRYLSFGLDEFVAPMIREQGGNIQDSKVVIVSAAGAVGKTTLARHVAYKRGAPYWDLAVDDAVGGHSLTGALLDNFGTTAVSPAMEHLKNGKLFLVVDAFDESRVKSNEAGFEAFIQQIADTASAAHRPAFVLFGRTQTAEDIWLLLADKNVKASLVEIQYFDRATAQEYIDKRIKALNEQSQPVILQPLYRQSSGHCGDLITRSSLSQSLPDAH